MEPDHQPPHYDQNAAADPDAGIFGLPYSFEEAKVVYLPVPWEATTSYGGGTSHGPEAIINASVQIDVFDLDVKNPYLAGFHSLPISSEILELNNQSKTLAQTIIEAYGDIKASPELQKNLSLVNANSKTLNEFVRKEISKILKAKKIPALIVCIGLGL